MNLNENQPIIFFDGFCNLCSRAVVYILKREKEEYYKFASLQSEFARQVLPKEYLELLPESVVVWENGKFYTSSEAALIISEKLRFPWDQCVVFKYLPAGFRNDIYKWIARRRYSWFGKKDSCMVPDPQYMGRFVL